MKSSIIRSLTKNFEAHAHQTIDGVEFWMARDLQHLLTYTKWDNFSKCYFKSKNIMRTF